MPSIKEQVVRAKSTIRNLTVAEVVELMEDGDVTLVDLREDAEVRRTGTLPTAIHTPRGMLEFYADPASPYHLEEFDPQRRTVVFCASGGRSALATVALQTLGYRDVAHLDGGVGAWQADGQTLVQQ